MNIFIIPAVKCFSANSNIWIVSELISSQSYFLLTVSHTFLFLCMSSNFFFYCILKILNNTLYDFWIQLSFFEECWVLFHQAADSFEFKLQTQSPLLWTAAETAQFLQLPGCCFFLRALESSLPTHSSGVHENLR